MKIYFLVPAYRAAAYAAALSSAEREALVYASSCDYVASSDIRVGEEEVTPPRMGKEAQLSAIDVLETRKADLRAKSEAACTELTAVQQSLLALTLEK